MDRHLFVPGLLGPAPGHEIGSVPALPNLETILARADRLDDSVDLERALFTLFGYECPVDVDLPTASVRFLADTGSAPDGFVMRADPLQLVPDRDTLIAFGLDHDPLASDETASLIAVFNSHFLNDGLRLTASDRGHLYLHCASVPSIQTHPLSAILGRSIDPHLPSGADQRWWRGLLNEVQMLCHGLDFNQRREAQGRGMLSGLWVSGGGRLPAAGATRIGRVVGDDLLACGLASLSLPSGDDELVVVSAIRQAVLDDDVVVWRDAIAAIEARLAEWSETGARLFMHPGNGSLYRWRPQFAWRWWRRRRPFVRYLDNEGLRLGEGPTLRL